MITAHSSLIWRQYKRELNWKEWKGIGLKKLNLKEMFGGGDFEYLLKAR